MTAVTERLRDVHAPARFIGGQIHWQMACGPQAIDASISATALHLLGPRPFPAYLDAFEQYRPLLCELAAIMFSPSCNQIVIDHEDIKQLLDHASPRADDVDEQQPSPRRQLAD
jgi:hypothetical protein